MGRSCADDILCHVDKQGRNLCRDGCPAHTNVHAYVSLTKEGKHQEALDVIRRRIPLPGTLALLGLGLAGLGYSRRKAA